MEKDLVKFNENIEQIESNQIVKYEDEKGNYSLIPVSQLFCVVDYLELDEPAFKKAVFNSSINGNYKYNTIKINKVVDKGSITHNKKDIGTLIDKEVEAKQIYLVRNALGCKTSFIDKEEALKTAKELNNRYLKIAEIIK